MRDETTERFLTDEERTAWQELVDGQQLLVRAAMYRALFDDVRPAWESVRAPQPARVGGGLEGSVSLVYGMARALFDDVRPGWDAYLGS